MKGNGEASEGMTGTRAVSGLVVNIFVGMSRFWFREELRQELRQVLKQGLGLRVGLSL